ncbi:hypothetical protein BDZ94DRAFT_1274651 [Collybia nuda]|uniref:F-box domain-containing protein n=1 Tax=Collybia nuda TaxID=64659 RepID=A0A9P5XU33_9AGAR|nr:hypothetical protein BDZ94DRAFT_1274651 [Collybia nuda]
MHSQTISLSYKAPHEKIPVEIWSEIFLYYLKGVYVKPLSKIDQRDVQERQFSWTLGRVCSRWRIIAYNEPRLWSHMQVPHASLTSSGPAADHYLKMAQSLFSLSKNEMISFSTIPYPRTTHSGTDKANPLPSLLLSHATQFLTN